MLPMPPEVALRRDAYSRVGVVLGVVQDEWARSMGWFFKDLDLPKSGECAT